MRKDKSTFALFFGNFPESLIAIARKEVSETLKKLGYESLMMDSNLTRFGAVESPEEGRKYAKFLDDNRGKFDGVVLVLPNFGDETGAVSALQDAAVPIYILAYPDELDKMGFEVRRDAFCGKFSIMDVFYQYQLPFTVFPPHTVHPFSKEFEKQIDTFDKVCKIVNGMKRMTVGAIGARTTAFKTVRYDELALQKYGITTEVLDLSEVFSRVRKLDITSAIAKEKEERLRNYTNFKKVPEKAFENLVRFGVVIDEIIEEYGLNTLALRCWLEMEKEFGVAPCVLLSEINDRGFPAACELDICNAIIMYGLNLASGKPATCLDWNNNYGDDTDKCILFHCGPVPQSLMTGKGEVIEHPMFAKSLGAGCGFGCNVGRIAPAKITFSSSKTQDGKLFVYMGEGEITSDPIQEGFFGCGGVAKIKNLQEKLYKIGYNGYRHHVSVTPGLVGTALREACIRYLGYEITEI
jgi:L-fucose isomerase and related proteins